MNADGVLVPVWVYWALAIAVGVWFFVATLWKKIPHWLFIVSVAAVLFAFRWPVVFYSFSVNRDEEFMLAGANTLAHFFKFWIYVDASTSGPLNVYPLALLGKLGVRLDCLTARLYALTLTWGALTGMFLWFRRALGEKDARLALVPAVVFFALTVHPDLLHYASELTPLFLLGVGGWLFWKGILDKKIRSVFFGSLLLASVPWAKMQGAPIAVIISFAGALTVLFAADSDARRRPLLLAWLIGSVVPTAVILLLVTLWGAWPDFLFSLKFLQIYKETKFSDDQFYLLFINNGAHFNAFWMPLTLIALVSLPFFLRGKFFTANTLVMTGSDALARCNISVTCEGVWAALSAATVAGAVFAVGGTSWPAAHYLFFLVMPLASLAALLFFKGPALLYAGADWRIFSIVLFLCATVLPQILFRATLESSFVPVKKDFAGGYVSPPSEIINRVAKRGDTIAIWGENVRLPVETQLPLATRMPAVDLLWFPAAREYATNRFIADMKARRPRFFADNIGPHRMNPSGVLGALKHEAFPALQQFIAANYTLLATADGVRVYVLKEGAVHEQ